MVQAVVPVKDLKRAKGRMAGVLSPSARRGLCLAMLQDVINNLARSVSIGGISVITSDESISAFVHSYSPESQILRETSPSSLNNALSQAASCFQDACVDGMLIVPGDVPLLNPGDIDRMVTDSADVSVVIVPDMAETGTNGLLIRPPAIFRPCFGPGSFRNHVSLAQALGFSYRIFRSSSLAFDMDYPADLLDVIHHSTDTQTRRAINQLGIRRKLCGLGSMTAEKTDSASKFKEDVLGSFP